MEVGVLECWSVGVGECWSGGVGEWGWADENTSPTRKRGVGIIPRLRVGLVLTPLVQLLAAISSGQSRGVGGEFLCFRTRTRS